MEITYRPMTARDVGQVPLDCHGGVEALTARIVDLGSAAILAFHDQQHVGQLQFRRHDPQLRSPNGIWSPDYWGDFGDRTSGLPSRTLGLFCYHVGQLRPGEARDASYQGRGIGVGLLDHCLAWAQAQGFEAMVAKCTPSHRGVMAFMGGQPAGVYTSRGFELVASWAEPQLREAVLERSIVDPTADPERVANVGLCVRRFDR